MSEHVEVEFARQRREFEMEQRVRAKMIELQRRLEWMQKQLIVEMRVKVVDEKRETCHAHVTIVVQGEVNVGQRQTETFVPGERDGRCGHFHFADASDDRLTVESGGTGGLVPFDDDV